MPNDDEPVFKRSRWGVHRYEYNVRNPIGLTLTVLTLIAAGVLLLLMHNHAGPFATPDPPRWTPPAVTQWDPPIGSLPSCHTCTPSATHSP
ncbi:hypothetical protein [Embleya sp. AB8]|uniref:hypothetical protein n=1 Tax=Embleya sp. AB8 TaxID=3156304 RepID=UPI003C709F26